MAKQVIAIIGARLNSSRLPGKQLLDLAGRPLIEHLAIRLQKITNISKIILATTSDDYNIPLVEWANSFGIDVFPYDGDVNDLMGRVDVVVTKSKADIIAYICGDSPLINPQSVENLIAPLISHDNYDHAEFEPTIKGEAYIHEGFSVYSREFWNKIMKVSEEPFEREHVASAFHSLKKVTPRKIAIVPEEDIFSSLTHRTSVDTPSDYKFMQTLYDDWYAHNSKETIVDLKWVIKRLKSDPELKAINAHVHQKTIKENSRKITIFTEATEQVGLGHLSRMIKVALALQDHQSAGVKLVIAGDPLKAGLNFPELDLIPTHWVSERPFPLSKVKEILETNKTEVLITDYKNAFGPLDDLFDMASKLGIKTVSIDKTCPNSDLDFIPSFYCASPSDKTIFGWDCYFLPQTDKAIITSTTPKNIIILTGSGDTGELGKNLPSLLDKNLPVGTNITWIVGPFAETPDLPLEKRLTWNLLNSPNNLHEIMPNFDAAICCFGVSFFEALKAGLPTVVIDPVGAAQHEEWESLKGANICLPAENNNEIVDQILTLLSDKNIRNTLCSEARTKLKHNGGQKLSEAITHLFEK